MAGDEPTIGEVLRRLDSIQGQMQNVVTVQHLELALAPSAARVASLEKDIRDLTAALNAERRERKAEDDRLRDAVDEEEESRQNANRWAIGIGLTVLTVLLGYVGFVVNVLGGAPT